jgi:hypothetical protein
MSLLDIFSSKKKSKNNILNPQDFFFGQYSGLEKNKLHYDYFQKAIQNYKAQNFLDAFEYFFRYLQNTDTENLAFTRDKSKIDFSLIQGSKIIRGLINEQDIYADAEIICFEDTETELMYKLLQVNYSLKYCKFAIKNNIYNLKFHGITTDTNPESLYSALLEMAIYADKYDDLLINEFNNLNPVNTKHIHHIAGKKVNLRLKYLQKLCKDIISTTGDNKNHNQATVTHYKIINKLYAVNYLISPGGTIKNKIRTLIDTSLKTDESKKLELNKKIKHDIDELLKSNETELKNDLQEIIKTFPEKEISDLSEIKNYIQQNLNKTRFFSNDYLHENRNLIIKNTILSLPYKFGLTVTHDKILLILWQYYYPDFFNETSFKNVFFTDSNQFDEKSIKNYISSVIRAGKNIGENVYFNINKLSFENEHMFLLSFLEQFTNSKQ